MSQNVSVSTAKLTLQWRSDSHLLLEPIPDAQLSTAVPVTEMHRRALQERVATGWNQWARPSNLAQIVLPQQVGIDIGVMNRRSGQEFRHALLAPQFPSARGPAVPVRMGTHAMDGSFSRLSFVPFPVGTVGARPCSSLNFTVETGTSNNTSSGDDNFMIIGSNASDAAAARAANMSIVVHPQVFWGAAAELSLVRHSSDAASLLLDAGELGEVTVRFSRSPLPSSRNESCMDGSLSHRFSCLMFEVTEEPLVIAMSFSNGGTTPNIAAARNCLKLAEQKVFAELEAASSIIGQALVEGYDAMATAIAWNVNFDPRVSVSVPVSRTFESSFDFIFFDWDMYFLSLMGATSPAAAVSNSAFEIAVSNLIEVTQTRSAYGMVMNKRAAAGSASSDSNDRTEPLVGSMVVSFIYEDSKGTEREGVMRWVIQKLYPTLLRWNQWAWQERRYNVGVQGGGLLVLGSDNNLPCEGSTIGLNSSQKTCSAQSPHGATARQQTAILESGMDNSPMYYNAFDDQPAGFDNRSNRLQLYDCQQSALIVSESHSLQRLAVVAGKHRDIAMLQDQAAWMSNAVNEVLWDNETGIYRQVDASAEHHGRFSTEISPTSFYPTNGGTTHDKLL